MDAIWLFFAVVSGFRVWDGPDGTIPEDDLIFKPRVTWVCSVVVFVVSVVALVT